MRLIDIDEVQKKIVKKAKEWQGINPDVAYGIMYGHAVITDAPTIEAEPSKLREAIEPYRDFCKWVAEWIFKEDFEESAGAFVELACRKLADLGYVFKDGEYWLTVDFKELEE